MPQVYPTLPSSVWGTLPSSILSAGAVTVSALSDLSGLQAWYKADAGTSSVVDGAALSAWDDQSGNGRHLAQATGANQPLFQTNEQNGLPGVQFVTDDSMTSALSMALKPVTFIFVVEATGAPAGGHTYAFGSSVDGGYAFLERNNSSGVQAFEKQGTGAIGAGTAVLGAAPRPTRICVARYTAGSDWTLRQARTADGSGNSVQAMTASTLVLGKHGTAATFGLVGFIYEFGCWNRDLTDAEILGAEAHLATRWGLA